MVHQTRCESLVLIIIVAITHHRHHLHHHHSPSRRFSIIIAFHFNYNKIVNKSLSPLHNHPAHHHYHAHHALFLVGSRHSFRQWFRGASIGDVEEHCSAVRVITVSSECSVHSVKAFTLKLHHITCLRSPQVEVTHHAGLYIDEH